MRVLVVPANNWMTHPNPMRYHFLFKRLADTYGCEVFVLNFRGLGGSRRIMNPELVLGDNIRTIDPHSVPALNPALYYMLNSMNIWKALNDALAELHIDVLVNSNIVPGLIATHLAHKRDIPVVYDCIEYYPESASAYFRDPLLKTMAYHFVKKCMEYLIRNSDVVITVCEAHAKLAKRIAPTKPVRVVPNGVDLTLFTSTDETRTGRFKADTGALNLIYVGSVDEWLDLETVLTVIHSLKSQGLRASLAIVGGSHGGYYLQRIRSFVRSCGLDSDVVFFGFVPYRDVPALVSSADIALAPYRNVLKNDVVPLKLLEYLASEKIVLSTRIPEISSRFGDLVYFYDGIDDLEDLLQSISRNPAMWKEKAKKAREKITDYSWDALAEVYYGILHSVLRN